MIQKFWISDVRKIVVCVDAYENGVLKGRFYHAYQDAYCFESLSQFLMKTEQVLEEIQTPQAYTSKRTFGSLQIPQKEPTLPTRFRKGIKATFELQVLFRQYSSWQGVLIWKDRHLEESFRSVLELVLLMDSALRGVEGSVAS